jgi:hypothetical protein
MLYGGTQFTESALQNENCTNVTDTYSNEKQNCTTIELDIYQEYTTSIYWLYRLRITIK